jgi:hypothetical protein
MRRLLFIIFIVTGCSATSDSKEEKSGRTEMAAVGETDSLQTADNARRSIQPLPRQPLELRVYERSNWIIRIDTISDTLFNKTKALRHSEAPVNKDSLLKSIAGQFPDRIILRDSCCILKAVDEEGVDKDIHICRREATNDFTGQGYQVHGFMNGFLVIMEMGYEDWSFVAFNPATRKYFSTFNEPVFIDDSKDNGVVYSYGNYYNEGQFEIKDLRRKRYFGFETFHWELSGLYLEGTKFYMEFTSNHRSKIRKYLRLDYQ